MNQKNTSNNISRFILKCLSGVSLLLTPAILLGSDVASVVDDFSNEVNNSLGLPRMVMDDTSVGGGSTSTQKIESGVYTVSGKLVPPRGQPGWVSVVFMLTPDGSAADVSEYEGVFMKIRIKKGMLSLSANSSEIANYDYHAALVQTRGKGFSEVKIPFESMRRTWSEQTKLNPATIASLSLVSVGMAPGSFAYEIEEIGFY